MLLLNVNGPINAGKTTVAALLAKRLISCLFIEVDNLLSDEEQEQLNLDFWQGISLRLERLDQKLQEEIRCRSHDVIIFSYPMSESNYQAWNKFTNKNITFKSVTLAPSLDNCLTNRGTRPLHEWEIKRIKEMYNEGYHNPPHADLVINNDHQSPEETVELIIQTFSLSQSTNS